MPRVTAQLNIGVSAVPAASLGDSTENYEMCPSPEDPKMKCKDPLRCFKCFMQTSRLGKRVHHESLCARINPLENGGWLDGVRVYCRRP